MKDDQCYEVMAGGNVMYRDGHMARHDLGGSRAICAWCGELIKVTSGNEQKTYYHWVLDRFTIQEEWTP